MLTAFFTPQAHAIGAYIQRLAVFHDTTDEQCKLPINSIDSNGVPDSGVAVDWYDTLDLGGVTSPVYNSSLIEFDQPQKDTGGAYPYPNHCLKLCAIVQCVAEDYMPSFPIERATFQVFKFLNQPNPYNEQDAPTIRTIELNPGGDEANPYSNYCCGYKKCDEDKLKDCADKDLTDTACTTGAGGGDFNRKLVFCAPWDGFYALDSEFLKTNGQFGFRGAIRANYYPDPMFAESPVSIDETLAFPGKLQMPIQVDVTNVHSVRSSFSTVGEVTKVAAQPYFIKYRLSKDAEVTMVVYDANHDAAMEAEDDDLDSTLVPPPADPTGRITDFYQPNRAGGDSFNVGLQIQGNLTSTNPDSKSVFKILDRTPKEGEGPPNGGQVEGAPALVQSEAWDGRNFQGVLAPPGNYVVSIQARTTDRFGEDYSYFKLRQMSLDPLKLTDIDEVWMNHLSTANASVSFIPTETSTVHFEVYLPGTTFQTMYTPTDATVAGATTDLPRRPANSSRPVVTNTSVTTTDTFNNTDRLVYRMSQTVNGKLNHTFKWDGRCWAENQGTIDSVTPTNNTYNAIANSYCSGAENHAKLGEVLPDGEYVYVLWAEIPYTDQSGTAVKYKRGDEKEYDAVRTVQYHTGSLPLARGNVDINIQPIGHSTMGSSPQAFGLDPFLIRYALSRDAIVTTTIKTTDGITVVKELAKQAVQSGGVLQQLSWDGIASNGRVVGPGVYMLEVRAQDALFPNDDSKIFTQTALFPVDLFRVVDVSSPQSVISQEGSQASIAYALSKSMDVQVLIFRPGTVLPTTITDQNAGSQFDSSPWIVRDWPRICSQTDMSSQNANECVHNINLVLADYPTDSIVVDVFDYEYGEEDNTVHALLRPIKAFTGVRPGDGLMIEEIWDGTHAMNLYNGTVNGKVYDEYLGKLVPDGNYPYLVIARSKTPAALYYANLITDVDADAGSHILLPNPPQLIPGIVSFNTPTTSGGTTPRSKQIDYLPASDRPTGHITVARGGVGFMDELFKITPSNPALVYSTSAAAAVETLPYAIQFGVTRSARVDIDIVATQDGQCLRKSISGGAKKGEVCRSVRVMSDSFSGMTNVFSAMKQHQVDWDGKDDNGDYVASGSYMVRLRAKSYPYINDLPEGMTYDAQYSTERMFNIYQIYDLYVEDVSLRGENGLIAYQTSVPMKTSIQIFKPGTTFEIIYDGSWDWTGNANTGGPDDVAQGAINVTDSITSVKIRDPQGNLYAPGYEEPALVRSIIGMRPPMFPISEPWYGEDYALQDVPDGTYPFRIVSAVDAKDIDSAIGVIKGDENPVTHTGPGAYMKTALDKVADMRSYTTFGFIEVARGDGRFVCEDWEKSVIFYPNPLRSPNGTIEVTKVPVPGNMSIKIFNVAGDQIRTKGYTCRDTEGNTQVMDSALAVEQQLYFNRDTYVPGTGSGVRTMDTSRNADIKCTWDKKNDAGRTVARGVYFAIVDFKATRGGNEHCQKVLKILIP